MRKLFLTLFSEGRGDRQCGNCLWRSLNPQHSCYPRLRHSVHSSLVIPASGILLTPCSLSTPQAFCALPPRYSRLRHSAHSFLVIPASGILPTPFSLSAPQAFCALPPRYPRLRHSAHSFLVIHASGILPMPFSLSPPQAFCALPHKSAHNPASSSLRPCVCGHHTPHDTPAVG